jgi:hypothetical protein
MRRSGEETFSVIGGASHGPNLCSCSAASTFSAILNTRRQADETGAPVTAGMLQWVTSNPKPLTYR